jgi:DNA topoisomerase-1
LDACNAEIEKTQKRLDQEKIKLEEKNNTKNHALGTSKINYMDPRITISWCKNSEVPIEKLFTKTLREKFAWAMDNEPSWKFC